MTFHLLLTLHALATAAMVGVIWIVQLVHYPMLRGVDPGAFSRWHAFHRSRITWIVAPLMTTELVLSAWLMTFEPGETLRLLIFALFISTCLIWILTLAVSMPLHHRLKRRGFDPRTLRQLVLSNWSRTLVYTVKLLLVVQTILWVESTR